MEKLVDGKEREMTRNCLRSRGFESLQHRSMNSGVLQCPEFALIFTMDWLSGVHTLNYFLHERESLRKILEISQL